MPSCSLKKFSLIFLFSSLFSFTHAFPFFPQSGSYLIDGEEDSYEELKDGGGCAIGSPSTPTKGFAGSATVNKRLIARDRELSWDFDDFLEEIENENQEKRSNNNNNNKNLNFNMSSSLNFGRRSFQELSLDLSDLFDEIENEEANNSNSNSISNTNSNTNSNRSFNPFDISSTLHMEELPSCSKLLLSAEDDRSCESEERARVSARCSDDEINNGKCEKNIKPCFPGGETKPKRRVRFQNFPH
eukprot:jgi/Psemu1/285453/fgenesh1_pg.88_\